ncbi:MAG: MBL fold metallo-hydrolase, partial [bacterium]
MTAHRGVIGVIALCWSVAAAAQARPQPQAQAQPQAQPQASRAELVLLGTGMPRPNPEASGPATAVVLGDRLFLFDAGPGVMRQLAAAGLSIKGATAVFVTHLHSDHTLGLPDLIFTSWVMGRQKPMALYGPHGLRAMT